MGSLKEFFRPEFLNRLDDIVVFDILSPEVIRQIVSIQIGIVSARLAAKDIKLALSEESLAYLSKEGYNPHYGARPLKRLIQDKILNRAATLMISREVKAGDSIYVDMKDGQLSLETKHEKGRETKKGKREKATA
jgi:ATP-dependent Clp protease ATP-binding subunit ClpB